MERRHPRRRLTSISPLYPLWTWPSARLPRPTNGRCTATLRQRPAQSSRTAAAKGVKVVRRQPTTACPLPLLPLLPLNRPKRMFRCLARRVAVTICTDRHPLPTRYSLPSSAQASIAFPREVDHTSSRALGLRSTLLVMQERPITVSPYSMRHQASLTAPARTTYLARQVPSSISSASIAWTPGASLVSASRMANLIAWSQRQNGCLRPAVTYTGRTASLFKFERTWKLATLRLRR